MTSIFQIDEHNDMWQMLPGGVYILARHHYTQPEVEGVFVSPPLHPAIATLFNPWRSHSTHMYMTKIELADD
jgi:hypothetical protein